VTLYEEVTDERGDKYRRLLSQASWVQTPDRANKEFVLTIDSPLQTDTLFLETHNGDNPPIELEKFQIFYPATRVLFKAKLEDALLLYYGNPLVAAPRYDLSLVAGQLLAADKLAASTAAEERLKKSSWRENQTAGKGRRAVLGNPRAGRCGAANNHFAAAARNRRPQWSRSPLIYNSGETLRDRATPLRSASDPDRWA
jgi:hypothetical protein